MVDWGLRSKPTKLPRKGATHLSQKVHAITSCARNIYGLSWRRSGLTPWTTAFWMAKASDSVIGELPLSFRQTKHVKH